MPMRFVIYASSAQSVEVTTFLNYVTTITFNRFRTLPTTQQSAARLAHWS
jgi:hypothetical protein